MMKLFVIFVSLVAFIDAVAAIYTHEIEWSVTKNFRIRHTGGRNNIDDALLPVRQTDNLGDLRITREHFCREVCSYVFRTFVGPVAAGAFIRYPSNAHDCVQQESMIKCPANPSNVYVAIRGNQYTIHVPTIDDDPLDGQTLPPAPQF